MPWWNTLPENELKEYEQACRYVAEDLGWDGGVSRLEWECYKQVKKQNPSFALKQILPLASSMAHKVIMGSLEKLYKSE